MPTRTGNPSNVHRPLRIPFHLRLWNLIKGILLYNTVYWEKASDGLKMPSLTREEREQRRPKADYEIIKPRGKPRARLDVQQALPKSSFEAQVSEPPPGLPISEEASERRAALPDPSTVPEPTYVKRRKYKRRRTTGADGGNSFFRRVFGKE